MIAASLFGEAGILLLAAGTPRQATLLSARRLVERRRVLLRMLGIALLVACLIGASIGVDSGRRLIALVGLLGIEALATAFGFTLLSIRSGDRRP